MWPSCQLRRRSFECWKRDSLCNKRRRVNNLTSLSNSDKVAIRHHCGYPVYGGTPSGFSSWRFYQVYGLLEYRLNNLSDAEVCVVHGYLTTLASLQSDIPETAGGLDTERAAVWTRNRNELQDRSRLYDHWRVRFCSFLGVPPGPGITSGSTNLVV